MNGLLEYLNGKRKHVNPGGHSTIPSILTPIPPTTPTDADSISIADSYYSATSSVDDGSYEASTPTGIFPANPELSEPHCKNEITVSTRKRILEIGQLIVWQNNKKDKASPRHQFFPRDKLHQIFDRTTVRNILTHPCEYCDFQRIVHGTDPEDEEYRRKCLRKGHVKGWIEKIVGSETYSPDLTAAALSLFGLLVVIQRPLLIVGFLDRRMDDHVFHGLVEQISLSYRSIPTLENLKISRSGLPTTESGTRVQAAGDRASTQKQECPTIIAQYWQDCHALDSVESKTAARDFMDFMWAFTVPQLHFSSLSFLPPVKFCENRTLPFVEPCLPIGKGGYGQVYKTHIYSSYCFFDNAIGMDKAKYQKCPRPGESSPELLCPKIYARKEIEMPDDLTMTRLTKELENLQNVQNSKPATPHVISILFAYVRKYPYGHPLYPRSLNLLMPFVETTLYKYLRGQSKYEGVTGGVSIIPGMKIYHQLQGVVAAIEWMINSLNMCRMDLKPSNMLVDRKPQRNSGEVVDTFILTDFGLAHFKRLPDATQTDAVTFPAGFTDTFAPPEAFAQGLRLPTLAVPEKFDVWAVGMIFIEIFTFLVLGSDGVKNLDHTLEENGQALTLRYWEEDRENGDIKVKDLVVNWILHLLKSEHYAEKPECRQFVFKNLYLASSMLHPAPNERISIEKVYDNMKRYAGQVLEVQSAPSPEKVSRLKKNLQRQVPRSQVLAGPVTFSPMDSSISDNLSVHLADGGSMPVESVATSPVGVTRRAVKDISINFDSTTHSQVLECKMGHVWCGYAYTANLRVFTVSLPTEDIFVNTLSPSALRIVTELDELCPLLLMRESFRVISLHMLYPKNTHPLIAAIEGRELEAPYAFKFQMHTAIEQDVRQSASRITEEETRKSNINIEESIFYTKNLEDMLRFFKILTRQTVLFRNSFQKIRIEYELHRPLQPQQAALHVEIWMCRYDYDYNRLARHATVKRINSQTRVVIYCATALYIIRLRSNIFASWNGDEKVVLRDGVTSNLMLCKIEGIGVPMSPEALVKAESQKGAKINCAKVIMTFGSSEEAENFLTAVRKIGANKSTSPR